MDADRPELPEKVLSPEAQDIEEAITGIVDDLGPEPPPAPDLARRDRLAEDMAAYQALVELTQDEPITEDDPGDQPGISAAAALANARRTRLLQFGGMGVLGAVIVLAGVAIVANRPGSDAPSPGTASAIVAESPAPSETGGSASEPAVAGDVFSAEAQVPEPPTGDSATEAPETWSFTGAYGLDITVTLIPSADDAGRIVVKGNDGATGSYTWKGKSLKMTVKQPVTLLNGNVEEARSRFTCSGQRSSPRLRCTVKALAWASTANSQSSQWVDLTATGRPSD